jgi:hypothetical protein
VDLTFEEFGCVVGSVLEEKLVVVLLLVGRLLLLACHSLAHVQLFTRNLVNFS